MATIRKLSSSKYRVDIRRNYTFIQSKTFSNESSAKDWADETEAVIEKILKLKPKKLKKLTPEKVNELGGIDLFHKLGVEINFMSFSTLADEYMKHWNKKDTNQISRALYWVNVFGNKPIKSISKDLVREAVDEYAAGNVLKGNGVGKTKEIKKQRSPNTVARQKAVLSSIFNYAENKGYVDKNPVDGISIEAESNEIECFLSDKERDKLLKSAKESSWDKLHLLILMAITTGMRKSELMSLRWSNKNFDRKLARLGDTKNGQNRHNPIPEPAMLELLKFREVGTGLIFASKSNPNAPFHFRVQWERALERAAIKDFRFHDLRHTAASCLVMNGATLHETGEILGHKSVQTTKRYAHLSTDHKSKLADRVMTQVFNA